MFLCPICTQNFRFSVTDNQHFVEDTRDEKKVYIQATKAYVVKLCRKQI